MAKDMVLFIIYLLLRLTLRLYRCGREVGSGKWHYPSLTL